MSLPGTIGYVVINFDGKYKPMKTHKLINSFLCLGIPVKYFPEDDDKMKPV